MSVAKVLATQMVVNDLGRSLPCRFRPSSIAADTGVLRNSIGLLYVYA